MAVRGDLADVRLAEQVFAPHYAAAIAFTVISNTPLRADMAADSAILADMVPGDVFEVLDYASGSAWGIAVRAGLVGYVDRHAIEAVVPDQ